MMISLNYLFGKKGENISIDKAFKLKDKGQFESIGVIDAEDFVSKGLVKSYGETLVLYLDYSIVLVRVCDRCLSEYVEEIEGKLEKTITKDEQESGLDFVEAENGQIDLNEIAVDELLMVLPSQSLCDDDCLGICPECALNLNDETCICEKKKIDPRFAKLLDLDLNLD